MLITAILYNPNADSVLVLDDLNWPDCYNCLMGAFSTSGELPRTTGARRPPYHLTRESVIKSFGVRLPPGGSLSRQIRLTATDTTYGFRLESDGLYVVTLIAAMPDPDGGYQWLLLYSNRLYLRIRP